MTLTERSSRRVYDETVGAWGREPTWDEFKEKSRSGGVTVNRPVAARMVLLEDAPAVPAFLYGTIMPCLTVVIVPVMAILYFMNVVSIGLLVASPLIAFFLVKVSGEGRCVTARLTAEQSEEVYRLALRWGAFRFAPDY